MVRSLNKKAFNRNLKTLFQHFLCPFTRELLLQPAWDSLKWENPFEHISNTGFLRQENYSLVTIFLLLKKMEFSFQSCEPDSTECQNKVFLKAGGLHQSLFHRIVYYVNEPILKLHWVHTKQVLNKNPFIPLPI